MIENRLNSKHLSFQPKIVMFEPIFYCYEQFFIPKILANFFLQIHYNENFQKTTYFSIPFESDDLHECTIP